MSDAANLDLIRRHIEAFTRGDVEAIQSQCAVLVHWNPPWSDGVVPYNKPWVGRAGVGEYCRRLMAALEWHSFEIQALLAAQDGHVVMVGRESFTVRATGRRVEENVFMALFKLRDGLIAEFTLCENTELVAAAFAPAKMKTLEALA